MDRQKPREVAAAPAHDRFRAPAWAGLAARVVLGAILIVSGVSKASAPSEEFAVVIEAYNLVPIDLAAGMAAILPWVEALLGFSLLLGYYTRASATGAGAMLAVFVLAILSTKARGMDLPTCGCFGSAWRPSPSVTVAVALVLIALAAVAVKARAQWASLDNWAGGGYT